MVSTNDKKVREAMQRHVLSFYKGMGGKTVLVGTMNGILDMRGSNTPYKAGYMMAQGGDFLVYTEDIVKFLRRIGFTDTARLYKVRGGPDEMYWNMCARACEEIYKEWVKAHPDYYRSPRGY